MTDVDALDPFDGGDPWADGGDPVHRDAAGNAETADRPDEDEATATPVVLATANRHVVRRVMGERLLEDAMPADVPAEGESWHVLTFGGIASTSLLIWLAHRQRLARLALATWSVNGTDVEELRRLVRLGRVGRLDVFCGSLAERRTPQAWLGLKETCRATGGRAVLMRNHAKVVAFEGEAWDGAIEGSANLANNSGCEQIVLTRDRKLAQFYFETFDGIKSMGSEV
jgi:hypothetical protein